MRPTLCALSLLFVSSYAFAQQPAAAAAAPLPDVNALMHEVEANQHKSEDLRKHYIYKSEQRIESMKKDGEVKKEVVMVDEVFWIDGVQVSRRLEDNGKPLSAEETKKENERIDKRVAKIRARREKAAAEGKEPHEQGGDFILPIARYLELGSFSNPRREMLNGRSTILIDYAGDPNAKTKNGFEAMAKDIAGTIYVDEEDRVMQHFDAHFVNGFKLGGGMLVSVGQGLNFSVRNRKINDEVWLQDSIDGNGHIRALLFFAVDGNFHMRNSDYRKFQASSKIMPGFTPVPDEAGPHQ